MKYIKALHAAAKGAVQGLKHGFILYRKDLEAFERMQKSQRKSFAVATALLRDMESGAKLARDIEQKREMNRWAATMDMLRDSKSSADFEREIQDDLGRRLEP